MLFKLRIVSIVLFLFLAGPAWGQPLPEKWVAAIAASRQLETPAARIEYFSAQFLETPYQAGTLGGGPGQTEVLTVNLAAVDCFTLLDYVEAIRRSESADDFRQRLIKVRYRDGCIAWKSRRHFFSDWVELKGIVDVTASIGGSATRQVGKRLNRQADGQLFLPAVPVRERTISYIPRADLSAEVLERLQSGDYLGIYSERDGLDVSHVGIAIRSENGLFFRHASSSKDVKKVTDVPLAGYLAERPGMIVFVALDP